MDLELTEEQRLIQETARDLAKREIAPVAGKIDETGKIPPEIFQKMADVGLFGIPIPPPFGGTGRGDMSPAKKESGSYLSFQYSTKSSNKER